MYDLAIAILGSGDSAYSNAADLLRDYLPENYIVYIPSYINSDGMKNVWKFLQDEQINYERVKRSQLIETLEKTETKSRQLVILNSAGIENEISYCLETKIPVFDLAKGLFQVTEVSLEGSESNAETTEEETPSPVSPENDLEPESITARSLNERIAKIEAALLQLEREIIDLTAHIVKTNETNWEPSPLPENPLAQEGQENIITGSEASAEQTVAYWKSKTGKFRKAGKSKARPGEVMVYLTEAEIESFS